MILNGYAILDAFITTFRLGFGLLVVLVGISAWRTWEARQPLAEKQQSIGARLHLLFQMAVLLLVLNIASWPVFYLVLLSYVPEWPGVMCIYGVTRIGTGSAGPARFLPLLLQFLQATKPVLIFLSGAWLVVHLLNRRTRTAPLTSLVLGLVLAAAMIALSDAVTEMAYLVIPKKEVFPSAGCCMAVFSDDGNAGRFLPPDLVDDSHAPWAYAAYFGINGFMVVVLGRIFFLSRGIIDQKQLGIVMVAALVSGLVNWVFLVGIAAPILLHMPNHQCPYDLVTEAPSSLVSAALFVGGSFCVGWAGVARWFAICDETRSMLDESIRRLLFLGFVGYLGSLLVMVAELALA
jgi:hypothetical protein